VFVLVLLVVIVIVIGVGVVIRGLLGIRWRFIGVIVGAVGLWVIRGFVRVSILPFGFIIVLVIISFIIFSILPFIWVVTSSITLSP
jgi:hypothetical protein